MNDNENKKKGEKWYFTFLGNDPVHAKHVQPIVAEDFYAARDLMFKHYGGNWGFQYSLEQWHEWCLERPKYYPMEVELPVIIEKGCEDV